MNAFRLRYLPVLLLLLAAGCRHLPTSPGNGKWQMTLQVSPPSPSALDQAKFALRVVDRSGHPIDGAQASVALTMAEMDMGTTLIPLQAAGDGMYTGTGNFGMAGKWNVKMTVTRNGQTETQTIGYDIANHS